MIIVSSIQNGVFIYNILYYVMGYKGIYRGSKFLIHIKLKCCSMSIFNKGIIATIKHCVFIDEYF